MFRRPLLLTVSVGILAFAAGCTEGGDDGAAGSDGSIRVAYVTNGIDPFWVLAEAGVVAGAAEFGVEAEVLMPPKGLPDQKRMVETLLARGIDGIAISPIDAANQVQFINDACKVTHVITQDSDAPDSDRRCFIGMDNYRAGREAGKLVKEVLPQGGKLMIFVGRLEQLNAQQRRQGVIDELLDRPAQTLGKDMKFDAPGFTDLRSKYLIVGTRTDNFDYAKAKSNAEDSIATHGDLACMVGLFAYNAPNCLQAVKEANKLSQIKIVSFDEQDATLQGIIDGHIHGTVSQQPFEYGRESVRVLAALARNDSSVIPPDKFLEVSAVLVRRANVDAFWANLKRLKGLKGEG